MEHEPQSFDGNGNKIGEASYFTAMASLIDVVGSSNYLPCMCFLMCRHKKQKCVKVGEKKSNVKPG